LRLRASKPSRFAAEADPGRDADIEAIAEEERQPGDGEDQFDHFFFAAFDRLINSRSLCFGRRSTLRFFFETCEGLR